MRVQDKKPAPKRLAEPAPKIGHIKPAPSQGEQSRVSGRSGEKKKNPLLTAGKILYCILVAVSAVIVVGYLAFTFLDPEPEVAHPEPEPTPIVTPTQPVEDDEPAPEEPVGPVREPLERREGVYNFLLAGADAEGYRTDTMMVLSYDTKAGTVGVVSVPRDTLIDRPGSESPKLVFGKGGVEQRVKDISDMLGVPIDYYIKINLKAFVAVIDYLGGVDFYVPCDMNYDDPYQDLHIHFTEGQQHLNGQQVMEVARFRQNNPDENGKVTGYWDTGRTETQQKLLIALAKKVLSWNSLTKVKGFVEIFNQYVKTDLELSDMLWFASQAIYVDTANGVKTTTLTGDGDVRHKGQSYCFQLDEQSTLETVNALINPYQRDLELDELNIFTVK